jgi:hypothetical protein
VDRAYQQLVSWVERVDLPWSAPIDGEVLMRVAVYAWVSTTRQAEVQTVEQQLDRLHAARSPSTAGY